MPNLEHVFLKYQVLTPNNERTDLVEFDSGCEVR